MFCFTVSCLHIKFFIWNNKMIELTLCYGSTKNILVEIEELLCYTNYFTAYNFFDQHDYLTILEIVKTQ